MSDRLSPTPWQTVGPYFNYCLPWRGGADLMGQADIGDRADLFVSQDHRRGPVARAAVPGEAIAICGAVRNCDGAPVPDALVEIWHADPEGRYADGTQPDAFLGFGRCATGKDGRFEFRTLRPGAPSEHEAPHVAVGVLGTGLNSRLVTRLYFDGDPRNERDPVLLSTPESRRRTMTARQEGGAWILDLVLGGADETVFLKIAR